MMSMSWDLMKLMMPMAASPRSCVRRVRCDPGGATAAGYLGARSAIPRALLVELDPAGLLLEVTEFGVAHVEGVGELADRVALGVAEHAVGLDHGHRGLHEGAADVRGLEHHRGLERRERGARELLVLDVTARLLEELADQLLLSLVDPVDVGEVVEAAGEHVDDFGGEAPAR